MTPIKLLLLLAPVLAILSVDESIGLSAEITITNRCSLFAALQPLLILHNAVNNFPEFKYGKMRHKELLIILINCYVLRN
jgi:hypothetical protein